MNDGITLTSALDWSTIHDFSSTIRKNVTLQDGDMVAIGVVYTLNGASDSIKALTIFADVSTVNLPLDNSPSSPINLSHLFFHP